MYSRIYPVPFMRDVLSQFSPAVGYDRAEGEPRIFVRDSGAWRVPVYRLRTYLHRRI